jgi:riboflavin kinase / FMN adenylyltransferase
LGHQAVLKRLKASAPHTVVFTFSNHPSEVLQGISTPLLTTPHHRLVLLEKMGIDQVIMTRFTTDFASQMASSFLTNLRTQIPFTHLILGHDAIIGHDRNRDLRPLSSLLGFLLEYLPPVTYPTEIISSSVIRRALQLGELTRVSALLGRPYSIMAPVQPGKGRGKELGFPTANLSVAGLALPPFGVYAVKAVIGDITYPAVANLGYAPTLHDNRLPRLEVHLMNQSGNLYGTQLEVCFHTYIRPEKKFSSLALLRIQIEHDIALAHQMLQNHAICNPAP